MVSSNQPSLRLFLSPHRLGFRIFKRVECFNEIHAHVILPAAPLTDRMALSAPAWFPPPGAGVTSAIADGEKSEQQTRARIMLRLVKDTVTARLAADDGLQY